MSQTTYLPADPLLAVRRQNQMRAWAQAQREREAARIQALQDRGVMGFECEDCGYRHGLHVGHTCNAAHPDADNHDGEPCGSWRLVEILPTLSLSNGLGGVAQVRYSVTGAGL